MSKRGLSMSKRGLIIKAQKGSKPNVKRNTCAICQAQNTTKTWRPLHMACSREHMDHMQSSVVGKLRVRRTDLLSRLLHDKTERQHAKCHGRYMTKREATIYVGQKADGGIKLPFPSH